MTDADASACENHVPSDCWVITFEPKIIWPNGEPHGPQFCTGSVVSVFTDDARAKPVLDGLCKRVEHMGPVGTGSAMKLAVNLPLALYWASLAEAMAVLAGQGIASGVAASVLAESSGGPAVLKNRLEVVVKTLEGTDQLGTFDINGLRKDLLLALDWSTKHGGTMPLSEAARTLYDDAIAQELGGCDGSSLTRALLAKNSTR